MWLASEARTLNFIMAERRSKREYILVDYDDDQLVSASHRGVFSVTSLHDGATETDEVPKSIPRVRRIRVGVEIATPVPELPVSSSSLTPQVPVPIDAVLPGLDYGPCRICGVPLGDQPFVPYQLMAKFCAVSRAAGMGILNQLEHDSVISRLEEVDANADVLYSIYLPRRVPYQCECSERCYILYRTACDGPLGLTQRVLAALGCDYRNVQLTEAERAGVERLRGRVAAGFANICSPEELGLTGESCADTDTDMGAEQYVHVMDDPPPWQYNPIVAASSAASAPPMPDEYGPPLMNTFSFGAAAGLSYWQQ